MTPGSLTAPSMCTQADVLPGRAVLCSQPLKWFWGKEQLSSHQHVQCVEPGCTRRLRAWNPSYTLLPAGLCTCCKK